MSFYVYSHIKPGTNEVFYIGKGSGNRAYDNKPRNTYWKNVVNKYGEPEVLILDETDDESYAYELEIYWIAQMNAWNMKLTNMTEGGEGNFKGVKHTEEYKELMSKKHSGSKNPFFGMNHTDKTKEKWKLNGRNPRKGKKHSKETRDLLSSINIGKKLSEETKKKISNSNKGRKLSEETKNKLKIANQKIVIDLETGIFYDSVKEAAETFGYKYSTLKSWLNGNNKNKTNLKYI